MGNPERELDPPPSYENAPIAVLGRKKRI